MYRKVWTSHVNTLDPYQLFTQCGQIEIGEIFIALLTKSQWKVSELWDNMPHNGYGMCCSGHLTYVCHFYQNFAQLLKTSFLNIHFVGIDVFLWYFPTTHTWIHLFDLTLDIYRWGLCVYVYMEDRIILVKTIQFYIAQITHFFIIL